MEKAGSIMRTLSKKAKEVAKIYRKRSIMTYQQRKKSIPRHVPKGQQLCNGCFQVREENQFPWKSGVANKRDFRHCKWCVEYLASMAQREEARSAGLSCQSIRWSTCISIGCWSTVYRKDSKCLSCARKTESQARDPKSESQSEVRHI